MFGGGVSQLLTGSMASLTPFVRAYSANSSMMGCAARYRGFIQSRRASLQIGSPKIRQRKDTIRIDERPGHYRSGRFPSQHRCNVDPRFEVRQGAIALFFVG